MSAQHLSRPTAMPSPTGRFSLEEDCNRTNPSKPSSSPSSASHRIVLSPAEDKNRNNNINCFSSSAPPSFSAIYSPFSSTKDGDADCRGQTNGYTAMPNSRKEPSLSRNCSPRQQLLEQNQQHQQPQESDLPPVQHPHLGATAAVVPNDDDKLEAPIASPPQSSLHSAFKAVQATMGLANSSGTTGSSKTTKTVVYPQTAITASTVDAACTPTSTSTNHSLSSIMQIPPTRVKSTKDRAIARDQRRHSSEDGRPCATGTTSSPPLNNRPSSSPPASFDKYAIPPKCRMVFHMRDEVPRPREEDKTGLSENRFYQYRPQLQPRGRIHTQSPSSSSSSSADKSQDEGSSLSTPISSIPVKKPNTGKCAKMVSFKEPEPWRDVTPPPPPFVVQNEKRDRQEAKQIRILFTRLDIPTITVTEPNQQKQQQQMREISSSALTPTVRRPTSEPILSNGSTVLSSSSSSSLRHVQAATRASTSTPPPTESSSPNQQQPFSSAMGGRHRRNMSMPIQFVSSPSPLTAAGSNVPGRMQAGQGGAMIVEPRTTATTKSGNRLLRLWKSATQKYSSHYSHHHSGHHLHGAANGVGCLGGKGSDLEPLVSMARE